MAVPARTNVLLLGLILILLALYTISQYNSNKINNTENVKSDKTKLKLKQTDTRFKSQEIEEVDNDIKEVTEMITTTEIPKNKHVEHDRSSLVQNIPKTYKVTQVDAKEMSDVIKDFLRGQSTEYGTLKPNAEKNLLEFFQHLDEKNIEIDFDADDFSEKRKIKILILTSYHSGSTFTGNLFKANPEVFYMFEPLMFIHYESGWAKPRIRQNETNIHLNRMLDCEFTRTLKTSMKYYPHSSTSRSNWFNRCFADKPKGLRYNDETVDTVTQKLNNHCQANYTSTVIKTIRADSIASIVPLLASGVKILYLVRDPRGLGNSRFKKKLDTAQDRLVEHMAMECSKNHRNIEFLRKAQEIKSLHNLLMRNFRIIRYEDIAYSTMERCRDIFHFVGLKMTEEVRNWIILNTSFNTTLDVEDTETLSDRSKAIASKWRLTLPYEVIRTLEDSCKLTMDELGFKVLKSKKEYADESIDLIDELKNIPYTF